MKTFEKLANELLTQVINFSREYRCRRWTEEDGASKTFWCAFGKLKYSLRYQFSEENANYGKVILYCDDGPTISDTNIIVKISFLKQFGDSYLELEIPSTKIKTKGNPSKFEKFVVQKTLIMGAQIFAEKELIVSEKMNAN